MYIAATNFQKFTPTSKPLALPNCSYFQIVTGAAATKPPPPVI